MKKICYELIGPNKKQLSKIQALLGVYLLKSCGIDGFDLNVKDLKKGNIAKITGTLEYESDVLNNKKLKEIIRETIRLYGFKINLIVESEDIK